MHRLNGSGCLKSRQLQAVQRLSPVLLLQLVPAFWLELLLWRRHRVLASVPVRVVLKVGSLLKLAPQRRGGSDLEALAVLP